MKNEEKYGKIKKIARNVGIIGLYIIAITILNSCASLLSQLSYHEADIRRADADASIIIAEDDDGYYYYKGFVLNIDATDKFDYHSNMLVYVPIEDGTKIILVNEGFDSTCLKNLGIASDSMIDYYHHLSYSNKVATRVNNGNEFKITIKIDDNDLTSKILLAEALVRGIDIELYTSDKKTSTSHRTVTTTPLWFKYDAFTYNYMVNFKVHNKLYDTYEYSYSVWPGQGYDGLIFLIDRQQDWSFFVPMYTDGDTLYNGRDKPEDAELVESLPRFFKKIYFSIGPLKPVWDSGELKAYSYEWPEYGSAIYLGPTAKPTENSNLVFQVPRGKSTYLGLITKSSFNATLTIKDDNSLEAIIESIDIEHNFEKSLPVKIGIGDYSFDANVDASVASVKIDDLEGKFVSSDDTHFALWYQLIDPEDLPVDKDDFSYKWMFESIYRSGFTIGDFMRIDNIVKKYIGYADKITFTFAGATSQKYNLMAPLIMIKNSISDGYLKLDNASYNEDKEEIVINLTSQQRPEAANFKPFLYNKYYVIFDHGNMKFDIYPKHEEYGRETYYVYYLQPGESDRFVIEDVDSEEAERILKFFNATE